jgi:hypothetical protein
MKMYVINLDNRPDRLISLATEIEKIGLEVVRIPAISSNELKQSSHPFVSREVAACFLSHIKALEAFIESGDSFGLIVEDDFQVVKKLPIGFSSIMGDLNFLQIGFLKTSILERFSIIYQNIWNVLLGILLRVGTKFKFQDLILNRFLLQERKGISLGIALNDVRPGAHAYIIDRKFATYCRQINNPIALSTDALFIAISQMRTVKIGRTRKSYIGQSKSPTSITQRFKSL